MAYIYRDTVNIYDKEAIARAIKTQETQFSVMQGKIQALITDTELDVLRNGGSTMYSRMVNVEATANGLTSEVSSLRTNLQDNYSTTESMRSEIQQSADSITTSVSTAISGLNTRVQQAETKVTPSAIISTVASTDGARAMVSAINQTASTVQISAAHINLVGAVTANDIAAGAITTEKLAAGAVTANNIAANTITGDKIAAGTITASNVAANTLTAAEIDVNSIFAQNVTATGTITGATLVGANCQIEEGSIGGWTLVDGVLTDEATETELTGEALNLIESHTSQMYLDMYYPGQMIDTMDGRISALESKPLPANISCTTLTATGQLAGDSLSVTHGITAVQIDLTGHVNAGNITGSDLYTQTSNAGTGSNAVITGTGRVAPTSASSKRYKDHISSVTLEQAMKVLDIPVINFKYKEGYLAKGDEMEGKQMPGFYAEDVYELIPEAIYHDKEGRVENWKERIILPLMLKVIQEQQHEIEELKRR